MAGTRIKIKGEMPAGAGEEYRSSALTSDQTAAWLQAFEDTILAAGFARTADTGQLQTPPAIPGIAELGYRCYALVDEFSATSPLVIKAYFGGRSRGTSSTSFRRLRCVRLEVAFATDGAGTLTGPQGRLFVLPYTGATIGTWQARVDTYAWRKDYTTCVVLSPGSIKYAYSDPGGSYTSSACEFFFIASRMRDVEGNVDLTGFNLYGAWAGATEYNAGLRTTNHILEHLALTHDLPPLSASGSVSQLLSPSARYVTGSESKPILQPALRGVTREGSEYIQPGLHLWQGADRLTSGVAIQAADGLTELEVMPLGYLFSPYDLSRLHPLILSNSGSTTIYPGHQLLNGDCGLALDWSDE